jgi:hypothetical protein
LPLNYRVILPEYHTEETPDSQKTPDARALSGILEYFDLFNFITSDQGTF